MIASDVSDPARRPRNPPAEPGKACRDSERVPAGYQSRKRRAAPPGRGWFVQGWRGAGFPRGPALRGEGAQTGPQPAWSIGRTVVLIGSLSPFFPFPSLSGVRHSRDDFSPRRRGDCCCRKLGISRQWCSASQIRRGVLRAFPHLTEGRATGGKSRVGHSGAVTRNSPHSRRLHQPAYRPANVPHTLELTAIGLRPSPAGARLAWLLT